MAQDKQKDFAAINRENIREKRIAEEQVHKDGKLSRYNADLELKTAHQVKDRELERDAMAQHNSYTIELPHEYHKLFGHKTDKDPWDPHLTAFDKETVTALRFR